MLVQQRILSLSIFYILTIGYIQASTFYKSFDMKSAIINYDINGSGKISNNNHLEISGQATLLFDGWGIKKLYKEKYIETTTGSLKNTHTIRTLNSEDYGVESHVDFDNKKINKNKNLIVVDAIKKGKNLYKKTLDDMNAHGTNIDTDTVLGYKCDIWLYKNKKICLYKGVPLKEEFTISNIDIVKIAVSIDLDKNISDDVFTLPDFTEDQQKGFLMEKDRDTYSQNIKKIKSVLKDEVSNTIEINSEEIELNSGIELKDDIFKNQKQLLPELLLEMRESRVCLENAEYEDEATNCLSKLSDIKEKISGEEDKNMTVSIWTQATRDNMLNSLEEGILEMKRRMPCINRSQNFDDISSCMQDLDD